MALDIIKDIVEAEAKADEMIKNAEADAASLKSEAEKKGEAIIADALAASREALLYSRYTLEFELKELLARQQRNALAQLAQKHFGDLFCTDDPFGLDRARGDSFYGGICFSRSYIENPPFHGSCPASWEL